MSLRCWGVNRIVFIPPPRRPSRLQSPGCSATASSGNCRKYWTGETIATDRGVGAGIAVLVLEPAEELGGGVPLLGRGVAIVAEDLVDDRGERPEHGGRGRLGAGIGRGLGGGQGVADLATRDVEGAGDLADGHAIAM